MNNTVYRRWFVTILGWRFGLERSHIYVGDKLYMSRWIVYAGGTLRLHKFWCGDDARAPHDHPWWFVTFPLATYHEVVHEYGPRALIAVPQVQAVRAWRFHYRPALYRHRVLHPTKPFWTIVITGAPQRHGRTSIWGFYPKPDEFVPYDDWVAYNEEVA